MKAAIIAPTAMLERYSTLTDTHLALAHLVLSNKTYREFYKGRAAKGDFVTVDNSLIELGEPLPLEDVIRAAKMIDAQEIVLPDVFANCVETLKVTMAAYREIVASPDLTRFKWMAVPQGRNALGWFYSYWVFSKLPEITTIGIAKHTERFSKGGRPALLGALATTESLAVEKAHHLLGCWSNPTEVLKCSKRFRWLRSVDSSIAVLAGLEGKPFPDPIRGIEFERPEKPMDFDAVDDPHPNITMRNVKLFIRWSRGV